MPVCFFLLCVSQTFCQTAMATWPRCVGLSIPFAGDLVISENLSKVLQDPAQAEALVTSCNEHSTVSDTFLE